MQVFNLTKDTAFIYKTRYIVWSSTLFPYKHAYGKSAYQCKQW